MKIMRIGLCPIPDAEYGVIVKEKSLKEFSVELPSKYNPALKKKAVFQDKYTSDDEFLLYGVKSSTLKLPLISPKSL